MKGENNDYDEEENHRDRLFKFVKEIKRINDNREFFIDFYKNNRVRFEENLRKIEGLAVYFCLVFI